MLVHVGWEQQEFLIPVLTHQSVMYPTPGNSCRHFALFPRMEGCAGAAVVLNSIDKKGRNFSPTSQDFARTKEAEICGWVMK